MSTSPLFSIVTPTYNREALLLRLYESLCAQHFTDMEWVVVDDGSTDDTAGLMARIVAEAPFPVVYRQQENGGKHRALNHAMSLASGYFFVDIDSDDYFLPGVLPRYRDIWLSQPQNKREQWGGMVADSLSVKGDVVGRPFPEDLMEMNSIDLRAKWKVRGDKLYFYKLAVVRQYPFPELPGERFLQESVCHRRIAQQYSLLATTFAGRVKDYQDDGLSSGTMIGPPRKLKNPRGARLRALEATNLRAKENARELYKECIEYVRLGFHCGESLLSQYRSVAAKGLWFCALLPGVCRYCADLVFYPELRGGRKGSQWRDHDGE